MCTFMFEHEKSTSMYFYKNTSMYFLCMCNKKSTYMCTFYVCTQKSISMHFYKDASMHFLCILKLSIQNALKNQNFQSIHLPPSTN